MAFTAQDIANKFTEDKIRRARVAPGLTPEDHKLLDEALTLKNPPLTGERKAKLDQDITAGTSPEPGGQFAQGVESVAQRFAPGAIGPDTGEGTAAGISHQLGATAVQAANTVLPLGMTNLANLGDLSDALFQGRPGVLPRAAHAVSKVLPRSQPMNEYLGTAPSPMVAGVSGAAAGMGLTAPGAPAEAAVAPPAPQTAGQALRSGARMAASGTVPLPRTNSVVANQVGLNAVLGTAGEAQRAGQEDRDPSLGTIAKEAVNPVNVLPVAAAGLKVRPFTETRGYQNAQRYGKLRREGGGRVPREYTEASGEPAMATHRAEGNRGIDEAKAMAASEREAVVTQNKSDIAEAEAAGKQGVERAAVEGEREFGTGHRATETAWMGEKGQPGAYKRSLEELHAKGTRVDPSDANDAMNATAEKYAATSAEDGGHGELIVGEKRYLSLGAAVRSLTDKITGYLGANPSLADYQNALREADTKAEQAKSSPSANQAFTEVAAKLREDAYNKFPGFRELSEQHKATQTSLERQSDIVYGQDEASLGEGTREGGAPLLPVTREERGVRRLMNIDSDVKSTELANELAGLSPFGRRVVDAVRRAKGESSTYVEGVRGRADQNARQAEEAGTEYVDTARRAKDERLLNQEAVDSSRIGSKQLGQLGMETALVAGGLMHAGRHSLPMFVAGGTMAARTFSPAVRARAAYLLGEPTVTPESMTRFMPALSGPMAMGGFDAPGAADRVARKMNFGDKAKDAIVKAVADAAEEKRKAQEAADRQAAAQEETAKTLRENQQ